MSIVGEIAPHFPFGGIRGEFDLTGNGRVLTLTAPFRFVDGDQVIDVPEAFTTDFNSVPRLLWIWFPPWEAPEAGLVHDYLYRHPGKRSRRACDAIHRRVMELKGERKSKRVAVWLGIRAGGFKPWDEYRAEDAAQKEEQRVGDEAV